MLHKYWLCILILVVSALVQSFNPISATWSALSYVSSVLYQGLPLPCHYKECCGPPWLAANITSLEESLIKNVYGQHLVRDIVITAFRGHFRPGVEPKKALALSFHGWPGGGKNYVSTFIANSVFQKGLHSQNVHFFSGMHHFPLEKESDIYKLHLVDWIRGNVSQCERSMFIFDEVDKMHENIIDGVKPFIDFHKHIDGVDYRKTVFIFLSNTGGSLITEQMLQLWAEGKKREQLKMRDFEEMIRKGAFNEKGGFMKSTLISSNLIDHYVPFLPMEEKHVKQCIADELMRNNHTDDEAIISEVLKDLSFGPEPLNLFSLAGCKRISQKVTHLVERQKTHWEL